MILKKFLILSSFFLLMSCNYEPIFAKKNLSILSIKKVELEGDKKINRAIIALLNISKENQQKPSYNLNLNSTKKIEITARDSQGNISVYKTIIVVNVLLENQKIIIKEKSFESSFSYNNIQNKFDLSQYQKDIETDLINKIAKEINIYLLL
tara:strand:+ start:405 stop:860 length:456 start_codon:yes stop_codon:yes gene_type:complete